MSIEQHEDDPTYQLAKNIADYHAIRKSGSKIKNTILDDCEPSSLHSDDGQLWFKFMMQRYRDTRKVFRELVATARHYNDFWGIEYSDEQLEQQVFDQFVRNGFRQVAPEPVEPQEDDIDDDA